MTITEAAEILRIHNEWRRGTDDRTLDALPFTTAQLGEAIDLAVEALSGFEVATYMWTPPERELWEGVIWINPGGRIIVTRPLKPPG